VAAPSPAPILPPLRSGFGCATGLLALGAVIVGSVAHGAAPGHLGRYTVLAALLLVTVAVGRRAAHAPLERVAFRLAMIPAAVPLALAVIVDLSAPIVAGRRYAFATSEAFLALAIPIPALILLAVATGRLVVREVLPRGGDRLAAAMRALAWGATGVAALLCLVVAARARRPTPEGYAAALPIVATLPAMDRREVNAQEVIAGPLTVSRSASGGRCVVELTTDAEEPGRLRRAFDAFDTMDFAPCGPLAVRLDARHGFWIVETPEETAPFEMGRPGSPTVLHPADIADAVRPPDAFTALAVLGVIVALAALLGRPRPSTLPAADALCRDGVVSLGRMVRIDDELLPLPADAPPAGEEIIAVMASPARSFRTHAAAAVLRVVPGRLAEHRLAAGLAAPALALAFVALAATPLATALIYLR
jgi:hypothetical protein